MFSEKLKYVRQRLQLTQKELADLMGVTVQTIVKWENQNKEPILKYQGKLKEICREKDIKMKALKEERHLPTYHRLNIGIDMLRFIDANGIVTASDIAAEFEVSTRTVYRFIRIFKHQGLVRTAKGRYGGIECTD